MIDMKPLVRQAVFDARGFSYSDKLYFEDPRTVPVMQACIGQTAGVSLCVYKRVV